MICQFASQYDLSSWSTYDKLFRARLVNNPAMSWDQIDEEYRIDIFGVVLSSQFVLIAVILVTMLLLCPLREVPLILPNKKFVHHFRQRNEPFCAMDLSSPRGSSINEGISQSDYSVRYSSFDEAVNLVAQLPNSCYLAKLDSKHAFRPCPVRTEDWCLLGHSFEEQYFIDTRLPFGHHPFYLILWQIF